MYLTLCFDGTGAITHFTHTSFSSVFYCMCLWTDIVHFFVLFPQTNALSVKSQDVDILGSIFSTRVKQIRNGKGKELRNSNGEERTMWLALLFQTPKCRRLESCLYFNPNTIPEIIFLPCSSLYSRSALLLRGRLVQLLTLALVYIHNLLTKAMRDLSFSSLFKHLL